MLMSWTGANRTKFHQFIRTNHYPELSTTELSCAELKKVIVDTSKAFFRFPDLLLYIFKSFVTCMRVIITPPPISFFQNCELEIVNQTYIDLRKVQSFN